jgi:hypothetical protein
LHGGNVSFSSLEKAACGPQWASAFSDISFVAAGCAPRAKSVVFAGGIT